MCSWVYVEVGYTLIKISDGALVRLYIYLVNEKYLTWQCSLTVVPSPNLAWGPRHSVGGHIPVFKSRKSTAQINLGPRCVQIYVCMYVLGLGWM